MKTKRRSLPICCGCTVVVLGLGGVARAEVTLFLVGPASVSPEETFTVEAWMSASPAQMVRGVEVDMPCVFTNTSPGTIAHVPDTTRFDFPARLDDFIYSECTQIPGCSMAMPIREGCDFVVPDTAVIAAPYHHDDSVSVADPVYIASFGYQATPDARGAFFIEPESFADETQWGYPADCCSPFDNVIGLWIDVGICGDNLVNSPSEECDGPDDAACPLDCRPDCTCPAGTDNCPEMRNPLRSDLDGDGLGDVCDPCPGVPCSPSCPTHQATECTSSGSAARECIATDGCCVQSPDFTATPPPYDDAVEVCVPAGGLSGDETISVTQIPITDPEAEVTVAGSPTLARDWGRLIGVYRFDPDGITFDPPAEITMVHEVTDIDPAFWPDLHIYVRASVGESFHDIPGTCTYPVEDPIDPGHFYTTCTATIGGFSEYALIAPLDSDGDGIPDKFDGVEDNCPRQVNQGQEDCDGDGIGDVCDEPQIVVCGQTICPWTIFTMLSGLGLMRLATPRPRRDHNLRGRL